MTIKPNGFIRYAYGKKPEPRVSPARITAKRIYHRDGYDFWDRTTGKRLSAYYGGERRLIAYSLDGVAWIECQVTR